jgi:hypothetical protein
MNINEQCRGECLTQTCDDEDYGFGTFPGYARTKQCNCIPIKCLNYKFCETSEPEWLLDCHGGILCSSCKSNMTRLTFKNNENNEECPVCFEEPLFLIKFPPCSHYFCKSCTRNICLWDETRYHLSPVPYGCPPCPNECENPGRGKQCYCFEYDEIQDAWNREYPEDFKRWNDDENFSMALTDTHFSNRTCPICRAKFHFE